MSRWALNVVTSVLSREGQRRREDNVTTGVETAALYGHKARNAGSHQKLEEKWILPWSRWRERVPADSLLSVQ